MAIDNKMTLDDIGGFLAKLSEKSSSVYWLSSPDFEKIEFISPAYEEIWGRSREELYANPELWITYLILRMPTIITQLRLCVIALQS